MKIIYIAIVFNLDDQIGVVKKIRSQISNLNRIGLNVSGYIFYDEGCINNMSDYDDCLNFIKIEIGKARWSFNYKLKRRRKVLKQIRGVFDKEEYDFIYFRYIPSDKNLLKLVYDYPNKIVFEHQTKELEEYSQNGLLSYGYISDRLYAGRVLSQAAAAVCVTDEISLYEKNRTKGEKLVTKTISNGLEVEKAVLREVPEFKGNELALLFVGNISPWHGIDRIIKGIADYSGNESVKMYIVGEGESFEANKMLVRDLGLENKVFFTGRLTGNKLDELFNKCHLAVGSLGLHRNNLLQASTLKVREYLARGIPLVLGYHDVDLERNALFTPYYLKVSADEQLININEVIHFAEKVYAMMDHSIKMREMAFENIDMEVKMKQLKGFLFDLKELNQ